MNVKLNKACADHLSTYVCLVEATLTDGCGRQVGSNVHAYNLDGRKFIRQMASLQAGESCCGIAMQARQLPHRAFVSVRRSTARTHQRALSCCGHGTQQLTLHARRLRRSLSAMAARHHELASVSH